MIGNDKDEVMKVSCILKHLVRNREEEEQKKTRTKELHVTKKEHVTKKRT